MPSGLFVRHGSPAHWVNCPGRRGWRSWVGPGAWGSVAARGTSHERRLAGTCVGPRWPDRAMSVSEEAAERVLDDLVAFHAQAIKLPVGKPRKALGVTRAVHRLRCLGKEGDNAFQGSARPGELIARVSLGDSRMCHRKRPWCRFPPCYRSGTRPDAQQAPITSNPPCVRLPASWKRDSLTREFGR